MFQQVEAFAGDPILSLMDVYNKDPRQDKINQVLVFIMMKKAKPHSRHCVCGRQQLNAMTPTATLYLPMEGLAPYRHEVQTLLLVLITRLLQTKRLLPYKH